MSVVRPLALLFLAARGEVGLKQDTFYSELYITKDTAEDPMIIKLIEADRRAQAEEKEEQERQEAAQELAAG